MKVPDEEKILEGQGENTVTRVVVYDNKAKRASGVTAETVLTLKASKKPFNLPIILGGAGLVVVILLLVVVLLRGGGGKGKRSGQPPPAPVVAGGAPPYGGGGAPPPYGGGGAPPPYGGGPPPGGYGGGGGYGAAPPQPAPMQPVPLRPPEPGGGGHPLAPAGGAPGVVQVRCPACNMLTMATPGQSSICFSCGQPMPRDVAAAPAASAPPPGGPPFPLTGGIASPLEPPPSPYGNAPSTASIVGAAGQFAIRAGIEVKVGRDPAQCPITLSEPRISGVHATLKFEDARVMVRDEGSNNGTYVNHVRIPASVFQTVPSGASLRFGPVEFTVRVE